MTIAEALLKATKILQESGIAQPRAEAKSILSFYLQKDKTFIISYPEYKLDEQTQLSFAELVQRRSKREPLQYITGKQEFYGLDFEVNKDVLIPRPETEIIVENAIELLQNLKSPRFCEIGTGSGCISISILCNVPQAKAFGLEISENALSITKLNAEKHSVADRLSLINSDVFSAIQPTRFNLIVSNPPYISAEEFADLQTEVRDYEPESALTDFDNGLTIIKKIANQSPEFLHHKGILLMEIGFNQSETVKNLFSEKIWDSLEILPDLQGIPRTIKAQRR